jgi:hypothetical protein
LPDPTDNPDPKMGGGAGLITPAAARTTLADRFIVPPFSILDARQGYWQSRKNAWIGLGIQSEIGRGNDNLGMTHPETTSTIDFYAQKRKLEAELGRELSKDEAADMLAERGQLKDDRETQRQRMTNGKTAARTFGQDLMRGEHTVGVNGKPSKATKAINTQDWVNETKGEEFTGLGANQSGTSIFDPVLTELAYRWFSPPGGLILDPFAGGSVRGIVASILNRRYIGIDLRAEQVAANERQAAEICTYVELPPTDIEGLVSVKISAASARLEFNGCDPDYIRDVCHASCCQSSSSPTGTMITINPNEAATIEARGGIIISGLLQPREGEKRCPFKTEDHLCGLHNTPDKPFGCIASPFTLNSNGTLIVRNRYKSLKCFKDGKRLPAYVAFRASLDLLFGTTEAARICAHLNNDGGDLEAFMPIKHYQMLLENDAIKHKRQAEPAENTAADGDLMPRWIVGNSLNVESLAPGEYDFIFSCPPYFDLEIYSDDPADLSNAGAYDVFIQQYNAIIAASVAMLKPDRFACFVVGDIRDKRGMYRNFVSDTIAAFEAAGAELYNEAILVTALGSLPIRVGKQFESGRKLGKTHQNVLVFVKGDPRKATAACGDVEVYVPEGLAGEAGAGGELDLAAL